LPLVARTTTGVAGLIGPDPAGSIETDAAGADPEDPAPDPDPDPDDAEDDDVAVPGTGAALPLPAVEHADATNATAIIPATSRPDVALTPTTCPLPPWLTGRRLR
jgi:hypothetical protein